jgi:hypothetical protein
VVAAADNSSRRAGCRVRVAGDRWRRPEACREAGHCRREEGSRLRPRWADWYRTVEAVGVCLARRCRIVHCCRSPRRCLAGCRMVQAGAVRLAVGSWEVRNVEPFLRKAAKSVGVLAISLKGCGFSFEGKGGRTPRRLCVEHGAYWLLLFGSGVLASNRIRPWFHGSNCETNGRFDTSYLTVTVTQSGLRKRASPERLGPSEGLLRLIFR